MNQQNYSDAVLKTYIPVCNYHYENERLEICSKKKIKYNSKG